MGSSVYHYTSISIRLLFGLLLMLLSVEALAYDFEVNGLYYNKLSNNQVEVTYMLTQNKGYSGVVSIPKSVKYNGVEYAVVAIGGSAFGGTKITKITIPNSITKIGLHAFSGCTELKGNLTIPNSVESIGYNAFSGCKGLTGSLVIPNSVQEIGSDAFNGCSGFTGSLSISSSVKTIAKGTFSGCSGLTGSLNIPNSVKTIDDDAFSRCSGFSGSLIIPNSVTSIGSGAFSGCDGLTGSLTIGNSVTYIGSTAFWNCKFAGSLIIPNSVQTIGNQAFDNCVYFTGELIIGSSVSSIGSNAFTGCSGFTILSLLSNYMRGIGSSAFYRCRNISRVNSKILEPFEINGGVFDGISPDAILQIPKGTRYAYWNYGWNRYFKSVLEEGEVLFDIIASGNGSALFNGSSVRNSTETFTISEGSLATITFNPDNGYRIKSVKVNGSAVFVSNNQYTVSNISKNTTMEVVFEAIPITTYTLSITASGSGSASYGGTTVRGKTSSFTVNAGSSATITFTPDNGYRIKSVKVNNTTVSVSNNQYTISSINANTTVSVEFEAIPVTTYTLTITARGNGTAVYGRVTIRFNTSTFSLNPGASATISFTPDDGYRIKYVKVNGSTVSVSNNQYTVSNINQDTTVEVSFEEIPTTTYTLSITASGSGSVSYGSTTIRSKTSTFTVNAGSSATITFSPDNGYRIKSVKVNNSTVSVSNNQYIISNINANTSVSVEFEAIPVTTYTLSITASGNGSASYNGTTIRNQTSSFALNHGTTATITFTPDNGYQIKSVRVNGSIVSVSNNQYVVSTISQNTTIEVVYTNNTTTNKFEVDGLCYNILSNNQVEVTYKNGSGNSYSGTVVIPEKVKYDGKEYSVIAIGKSAFYWCKELTGSLSLPSSIKTIGDYAFQGCDNLTGSLVLPNSLISIGLHAFDGCSGFRGSLKIPNTVTSIGGHAFSGCSGLTGSLEIPNSITTINECTFANCSGFAGTLTIPNSVISIGYGAFLSCSGFTGTLAIPNSVTLIHGYAFAYCKGFAGTLDIPNSIKAIEESTFAGCKGLCGMLIIPNSVTTIGDQAFKDCNGIDGKLVIPNSVISIGKYAFFGCSSLAQVESQIENPYNIDNSVFQWISSSARLYVPKGSKSMYDTLSGWATNFKEIVEIGATTTYTLTISSSGNGFASYDGTTIRSKTSSFTVNEGTSATITFSPDNGYRIKNVKVNNSIVSVSDNQYTISSINANTTVEVEFEEILQAFTADDVNYTVVSVDERTIRLAKGSYGITLEVPAKVSYQNAEWTVTGIDNGALANNPDLAAVVWNPDVAFTEQVSNPNFLLYVNQAQYAPSSMKNVVVNGNANSITLTDAASGNDFHCPQAFTAQKISYTHNYGMKTGIGKAQGWETIALPFDVQKVTHESKGEIVSFANWRSGDSKRPFWLMQLSASGWTMATSIKANTPYIISMPNNDEYKSGFLLNGRVTFSAENVNVAKTENLSIANYSDRTFVPTFSNLEKSNDMLALNVVNDIERVTGASTEGSTFERNLRPVHPFEAYMTSTSSTRSIGIDEGMATGIIELITALSDEGDLRIYNLNGQLIKIEEGMSLDEVMRELPAGVYIVNGKKTMIR